MDRKKYTIVLVTAGNCSHCNVLKQSAWPSVSTWLAKNNFRIVTISVNKVGDPLPGGYPSELSKYARWYPTLIAVDNKSWDSGSLGNAFIMNGVMRDGKAVMTNDYDVDSEGIKRWVESLPDNSFQDYIPTSGQMRGGSRRYN